MEESKNIVIIVLEYFFIFFLHVNFTFKPIQIDHLHIFLYVSVREDSLYSFIEQERR